MSPLIRKLIYSSKYRYVKLSMAYRTYMFDKEIKEAYGKSFLAPSITIPEISPKQIKYIVTVFFAFFFVILAYNVLPNINFFSKNTEKTKIETTKKKIITKKEPKSIVLEPKIEIPTIDLIDEDQESIYTILANKKKKKLHLYSFYKDGKYKLIKSYTLAIGEKWGRKEVRGDLKTPEGFYWFVDKLEDHQLPPIYGVKAFVTNYPNDIDLKEKRTGAGIWLHGHGKEVNDRPFTRGCLRLVNKDIADIAEYLNVGTPLLIAEDFESIKDSIAKYYNWKKIAEERARIVKKHKKTKYFVENFVVKWKNAWMKADIEEFAMFYSKDNFKYKKMEFEEWKNYKKAIFTKSNNIKVKVANIKLMKWINGDAIIAFDQHYISGSYESRNKKMLTIRKNGSKWKIINEYSLSQTN